MRRVPELIDHVLRAVIIVCMAGIMFAVCLQVIARGTIGAYSWPEELSVILMLWGLFLGGAYVLAERGHVGITFVVELMSPRARLLVNAGMHGLIILFCAAVIYGSVDRIMSVAKLKTGALGISRAVPNASIPVSCAFYILVSLRLVAEDVLTARRLR